MAKNLYSLQLLRNSELKTSYADAVSAITSSPTQDGVIKLARYTDSGTDPYSGGTSGHVKTIFGIYHTFDGESGYTIYESYKEVIKAIKDKIDAIAGEGSGSIADQIRTAIEALDYTDYTAADSKVVTAVSESDGVVSADGKDITEVKLTGYETPTTTNTDNTLSENKVAATDDLGTALEKLQKQINSMDKDASAVNGQVVTTVVEADGIVTETKANVKDLQLGGYTKEPTSVSGAVGSTDTINTAISKLENNIAALSGSTDAKIEALDATATTTTSQVFGEITQTDGKVSATTKLATSLVMEGLAATADTKIAAADTLGTALAKLQGQIDSMDLAAVSAEGSVITSVSESDGKVSATTTPVKDVKLTGYVKDTTKTGDIAATDDIEDALSKLENKAAAITIANNDGSINVTTGATGTDINVNIKSGEHVLAKDGNAGLYTNIALSSITPSSTTVKEEYQLTATDGTKLGDTIKIYKDSSLKSMELVSGGTADAPKQYLRYVYVDVDGNDQTVDVNVSALLAENEFKSGVTVTSAGIVTGVVDTASEKNESNVDFLTVGADGFKVSGIKDAIDTKINKLDVTGDTAQSGKYITHINEEDGKIEIGGRADIAAAPLNGYAKGTAPANSAITSADTINQALAKLEHQVDAAKAAATTKVVEGTDAGDNMTIVPTTSATDGSVTYTVNLTDVAKASAVGLNTDGSHKTTTGKYTSGANTITEEIAALDSALDTVSGKVDNAQAEIDRMESAIGLKEDGTYSANTANNYTSAVTSVNGAIDALDDAVKANEDAIKTLSGNSLSGVSVNGKTLTITNNVATQTVNGKQTEATATNNEAIVVETDNNGNLTLGLASLDAGTY